MLKSDSFWFIRLFTFVAGSLRALFGCEVACLGETSGFGSLSDSRYVLILDFVELVREIPLGSGPDDRTERGKHSRRCQSSSAFEDMALLMNLLNPEAKKGRAPLGMRWMGWLWDLRDWMRALKEGESSGWVFEVEVLEECGGLIMGSQVL